MRIPPTSTSSMNAAGISRNVTLGMVVECGTAVSTWRDVEAPMNPRSARVIPPVRRLYSLEYWLCEVLWRVVVG
jgi:hypothetical protein